MAKRLLVQFCMLMLVVLLTVPVTSSSARQAQSAIRNADSQAEEEQILRFQAKSYAQAYAAADAIAIANMWAIDGTYTDSNGDQHIGRPAIQQFFASGFKRFGGQPMDISIDSLRFPAPGVAIEEGTSRLLAGPSAGHLSHYTAVHVKENGQWLMTAVNETDMNQPKSSGLKELSWILGDWTAKNSKNVTSHFKADWVGNQNFIKCEYSKNSNGNAEDVDLIGWNPVNQEITSWHFDSNGGFGKGKWVRYSDSWLENATTMETDGSFGRAINLVKKVNDNSFTWTSTGRSINGRALPDTSEVVVTRDQVVAK